LTTDGEFVRKLKARDPQAYVALVERFEAPLYRYFLASHGDDQLATEQSADCFGDLVVSLPKMTGGSDQLRAFVFAVARNVLRRSWRSQKRAHVPLGVSDEPADNWPSPDAAAEQLEEARRVIEAIRLLDEPTRDLFVLRFVELMPLVEIAATDGEPIGTIESRLSRGRERLAQILHTKSQRYE
jgi:RNA polymerase sigma-70 factor (ECF subfamily)